MIKNWREYSFYGGHKPDLVGKRKVIDNTIYTFDIETTSYLVLNGKQYAGIDYEKLTEKEQEESIKCSTMYIWMFGINDQVYYGRTWEEFKKFLDKLEYYSPYKKYVFVHNLSFEFQYLKSVFHIDGVIARKMRKVMEATLKDYNINFRCSYMMSNVKLEQLPKIYNLPVEKLVGNLDYSKIRNSKTKLDDKELSYAENDCLVVYHYIKYELETYKKVSSIPMTSTGHVRRELKELIRPDVKYRRKLYTQINTDPHIYNLMIQAFQGGYTHANYIYTDKVLKNIDSWDFTSSYPYVMVTHKYPSTEFKRCYINSIDQMSKRLAYLLVVKFKNVESKFWNNFISESKCRHIRGAVYDNGRIIKAQEFEMTLTDVDFRLILEAYNCEYEIIESWYSMYNYLPKQFINFVLDKYVIKTQYKNIDDKKVEYEKEKAKFNALYGMSVTNTIRNEVIYKDEDGTWNERELTNEEIEEALQKDKKSCFMNFAWGVWVTAYARNNLIKNIIKLDDYVVYADTDSIKLIPGYDKKVIDDYNDFVERKIKFVSNQLDIDMSRYSPKDVFGIEHTLGVFDHDAFYQEFITQGAKKYAYKKIDKKTGELKIGITVSGVPKSGAKALKDLKDFKDSFVFKAEDTNKSTLYYCENQEPFNLVDFQGNECLVTDKTGCCLVPATYELGKSLEYATLLNDASSDRAIYNEKES